MKFAEFSAYRNVRSYAHFGQFGTPRRHGTCMCCASDAFAALCPPPPKATASLELQLLLDFENWVDLPRITKQPSGKAHPIRCETRPQLPWLRVRALDDLWRMVPSDETFW